MLDRWAGSRQLPQLFRRRFLNIYDLPWGSVPNECKQAPRFGQNYTKTSNHLDIDCFIGLRRGCAY